MSNIIFQNNGASGGGGGGGLMGALNGLWVDGDNVKLGGELIEDTWIDAKNKIFSIIGDNSTELSVNSYPGRIFFQGSNFKFEGNGNYFIGIGNPTERCLILDNDNNSCVFGANITSVTDEDGFTHVGHFGGGDAKFFTIHDSGFEFKAVDAGGYLMRFYMGLDADGINFGNSSFIFDSVSVEPSPVLANDYIIVYVDGTPYKLATIQ